MRRKFLALLLIFMFCLVACDSAIEGDDDDFADLDEPIAAAQDDEQDAFDDEAEELGEELDDEQEDAEMDAGNEEDSAEFFPATIEEFDALFTDQLGYDLDALDDEAFLDVVQQELGFDSAEEAEMYLADLFGDEGSDNEDGGSENFDGDGLITFIKKINVFGAEIWATDDISDEQLLHAAVIMAEYLDNDEDGVPDNPLITDVMEERNATLLMYVEAKFDTLDLEMVDEARGFAQQPLFRNQVSLEGITPTSFDTTYEEVLHLITAHGWAYAYPDVWGETPGTELADAMDIARGGRFEQIPDEYPEDAWYSYDDVTCDYVCMGVEYVYWAYTSLLGAQQYRMDEIDHEWRLGSAELIRETDTAIVDLLTDPEFNFGMVLPDGNYDAMPLEIEPISFESNTEAQDDEAEELGEEQDDEADLDDDSRSSILGFGDPNDSHIGGTVLRRPVREAPDNIYTDSGIYFTDEFGQYNKAMEVYGLTFIAREEMSDQFMLQVAETLKAMFVQTDETDRELQEAVLKEMYRYYAVLPIVSIAQFSDIGDLGGQEDAASFADIIMNDVETGQVNEVVEHILHAVTSVGMHYALNGEFGLHEESTVTQAMREATELGYFNYVSGEPEGSAEDSKIRVQEYVYWVIVTGWNIQERYYSGGEEWTIRNADALQAQQPFAYELFADYIPNIMTVPSEAVLQPFE